MRRALALAGLAALLPGFCAAQITWANQTHSGAWPQTMGYEVSQYDAVSGYTAVIGVWLASGNASFVNGSTTMTWASGDKFSVIWQNPDQLQVNGSTNISIASGTSPGTCTTGAPMGCTTITMASAWGGTTGTYAYKATATNSIYGADMLFYNSASNTWKHGPVWGDLQNLCIGDQMAAYGMPETRQTPGTAIDTKRHRLYMTEGVNQSCTIASLTTNGTSTVTATGANGYFTMGNGLWVGAGAQIQIPQYTGSTYTVASVDTEKQIHIDCGTGSYPACPNGGTTSFVTFPERAGAADGSAIYDLWYMSLNPDPTTNTWTQVQFTVANNPQPNREATMDYDPDDDCFLMNGSGSNIGAGHYTWVFGSADGNPGGVLSASQTACGVVASNLFNEILSGGSSIASPPAVYYPHVVYDHNYHAFLEFGGLYTAYAPPPTGTISTDVWQYCPTSIGTSCGTAQTWAQKSSTNQPTPYVSGYQYPAPLTLYNDTLIYHYVDGPADFQWSPVTNAWTTLTSLGGGAQPVCTYPSTAQNGCVSVMMNYDPGLFATIAFQQQGSSNVFTGNIPTAPTITTNTMLPGGTHGTAYTDTLAATGNPGVFTWTVIAGSVPPGTALSSGGVLSGTPTMGGTFTFEANASNGVSPDGTKYLTVTMAPLCTLSSIPFPGGVINAPYSQPVLTSECASPAFALTAGSLPTGLTLNTSTGVISGTPTATGTSAFTIGVGDANGNPTQGYGILIVAGAGSFSVPVCAGCLFR
jgi:Putative Ig domain